MVIGKQIIYCFILLVFAFHLIQSKNDSSSLNIDGKVKLEKLFKECTKQSESKYNNKDANSSTLSCCMAMNVSSCLTEQCSKKVNQNIEECNADSLGEKMNKSIELQCHDIGFKIDMKYCLDLPNKSKSAIVIIIILIVVVLILLIFIIYVYKSKFANKGRKGSKVKVRYSLGNKLTMTPNSGARGGGGGAHDRSKRDNEKSVSENVPENRTERNVSASKVRKNSTSSHTKASTDPNLKVKANIAEIKKALS